MSEYVPGVCNIGPPERRRRRRIGYLGIAGSLAVLVAAQLANAGPWFRIVAGVPAAFGASGFLQDRMHFCANFGWFGYSNFGGLGEEERVMADEARRLDRRKARTIGMISAGIGLGVGLVCVALPLAVGA